MTETMWAGIGCLVLGGLTLANWWFEMFSDCDYADLCRSITKDSFDLGRNTIALIEPAGGMMFLFGGGALLLQSAGLEDSLPCSLLVIGGLVSIMLSLLGLIPFRLPRWMYPDWQADKRWWRAERARLERKAEQARQAERAQQSQQPHTPDTAPLPHPTGQTPPPTLRLPITPDLPEDDPPPHNHNGRHRRETHW